MLANLRQFESLLARSQEICIAWLPTPLFDDLFAAVSCAGEF
jgi:hypothetical protein